MSSVGIFRIKVTLEDVEPDVIRRIEVPADIRLDRLHRTLQAAFGWTDTHLYEFRCDDTGWGDPDPTYPDDQLDAKKMTLIKVFEEFETRQIDYLYDFGDAWWHTVRLERGVDPQPGVLYPRLVSGIGESPPEDVGGPLGFADLVEAFKDPEHELHAESLDRLGEDFDPLAFDLELPQARVAMLAEKWSKKSSAKKPRAK
ncbi:MAG: plasmid pRiA4b ORF-3 family protein [Alphaproteobacteria bacterium]|nr:plasmid pRiA4b ORF-3 family protein [Alphaproteobacteria bacterium]